jgi:hypothetical protein
MPRLRMSLVALFAVAAISVVAVSSASAVWMVGGTNLSGSVAGATTGVAEEHITLLVPSLEHLTILCPSQALVDIREWIILPTIVRISRFTFLGCNSSKLNCRLEESNQAIPTLPLLATPTLGAGESVKLTTTAETKATLAEIKFDEANTCALAGDQPLKGAVNLKMPTGQLESSSQQIEGLGSVENNSMEIGAGNKAYLIGGKILVKLQSGSKWSFL